MTGWLLGIAALLLLPLAAALWRAARGPTPIDRMLGAQFAGTNGVAVVVVLAAAGDWAFLDVALVLALLAAFAALALAKATSRDGLGDPEEER